MNLEIMNRLFNHILDLRKGHYAHVVEVANTYELDLVVETIIQDHSNDFTLDEIKEFFNSISVYYLADVENEADETAVYDYNFNEAIDEIENGLAY